MENYFILVNSLEIVLFFFSFFYCCCTNEVLDSKYWEPTPETIHAQLMKVSNASLFLCESVSVRTAGERAGVGGVCVSKLTPAVCYIVNLSGWITVLVSERMYARMWVSCSLAVCYCCCSFCFSNCNCSCLLFLFLFLFTFAYCFCISV